MLLTPETTLIFGGMNVTLSCRAVGRSIPSGMMMETAPGGVAKVRAGYLDPELAEANGRVEDVWLASWLEDDWLLLEANGTAEDVSWLE